MTLFRISLQFINALISFVFVQSIDDPNSPLTTIYKQIMSAISHPLFYVFPVLERRFLWAFPKRKENHRKLSDLNKIFMSLIENKKGTIRQEGYKPSGDDTEQDLLTMMIEANETDKLGGLSDQELVVRSLEDA